MLAKHKPDLPLRPRARDFDRNCGACLAAGADDRNAWTARASEQREQCECERERADSDAPVSMQLCFHGWPQI